MIGLKKKESKFFEMLIEFAGKIVTVGEAFQHLVVHYENVEEQVVKLKEMETDCDVQTHKILSALNASFVTPFDREDIYDIAKEMDEIVDCMEEVANRFIVFDIKELTPETEKMTVHIVQAIRELEVMFKHLPEAKKNSVSQEQAVEVNRIENEGDLVYRQALSDLFRNQKDPIELVKWKQIYELLEDCIDSCEGVANSVEGVIMKYA